MPQVFDSSCVVDSCMYLIRDIGTGKEIAIFGDIEPDSVSLTPRNAFLWTKIAPVFEAGRLGAMLIECSYDNSVAEDRLYGHMAPRYLIEELKAFAAAVETYRQEKEEQLKDKGRKVDGYSYPALRIPTKVNKCKFRRSQSFLAVAPSSTISQFSDLFLRSQDWEIPIPPKSPARLVTVLSIPN